MAEPEIYCRMVVIISYGIIIEEGADFIIRS